MNSSTTVRPLSSNMGSATTPRPILQLWRLLVILLLCGFPTVAAAQGIGGPWQLRSAQPIAFQVDEVPPPPPLDGDEDEDPVDGEGEDEDEDEDDDLDDLLDQDISSLRRTSVAPALDMEVSSVSRQKSSIGRSPAAIYVVTQEMIKRSGARSIPEVLRLVPGLHVAHIDSNKWSISSRGYAGRFSSKLLVQIDGRMVYTPLFAGVFWDIQDLLLDDIERIEVIRGPGATVWGANAVNGVINILTKHAKDTHGVYAFAGGGTEERGFAGGRIGGRTAGGVDWRIYSKWLERDAFFNAAGREHDDWRQGRAGFRMDWDRCCDSYTLQGDIYTGSAGDATITAPAGLNVADNEVAGGNVLTRWTRRYSEDSDSSLQLYYDRTDRISGAGFDQNINIFDVDFQFRNRINCRHNVIWGMGYRRVWDALTNNNPMGISTVPQRRTLEFFSGFIQDEITLCKDKLYFTAGAKLSDNPYTDFEIQPTGRLLYLPDERSAAWLGVSRAVRTPSRVISDLRITTTPPIVLFGNPGIDSEELLAYELGYRAQPVEWFSWDGALFFNKYRQAIATRVVPGLPPTMEFFNGVDVEGMGGEISAQVQVNPCWKLTAWYSFLRMQAHASPQSAQGESTTEGGTPKNQAFLMSSWNLNRKTEFDLIARYVDNVPDLSVPSYITMDLRLSYRPCCNWEFVAVGQNLLDSHHQEYGSSNFTGEITTEAQRGVYGMVILKR